ncbi:unnamed protein product [Mucor fragilis]
MSDDANSNAHQTYDIVVSLIEKEHNVKKAILYIQQIKTSCFDTERLLAALATLIKIVDTNAFLLNPDNSALLYHLCRLPLATPTWSLTNMAGLP